MKCQACWASVIKYVKLQHFECNYLDYCVHSGFGYEVAIRLVSMLKVMMIRWKNNVVVGYGDMGENRLAEDNEKDG